MVEALFFLGVCERTVERHISKFLVNGGVKPEPVGRSYGSISFALRDEPIFLAYEIWKPKFLLVVQFPFDNRHSTFSQTTFFEIGVFSRGTKWMVHENVIYQALFAVILVGQLIKGKPNS